MENREDRLKVQTRLGVNMVVEAGAGTGKTTLLITRLCLAVLAQGISIEKLVALTFTEKAAAEIKMRLITALHEVSQALAARQEHPLLTLLQEQFHLKAEEILPRAEAALSRLDRASVGTIHSFCADILKTFPLEAGLSPSAEIDSGQKASRLFEARWNSFLDRELGLSAPRAAQWKKVLPHITLAELKEFAQILCSGKIEQYDYFAHRNLLCALCEEKSRQAQAWSTAFLDGKKPRNAEKALAWAAASLKHSAAFLSGANTLPPPPEPDAPPAFPAAPSKGWDENTFDEARALVQFALKITPEKQTVFLQALQLVRPLTDQVRQDYAREGILSFDDLIVKTRNLLQRDFYVRRLLKEKFDALFIDEFQDTDPVQGELLLFLAEEKQSAASRWQQVRLEPGKLFVVGDPKQSIYRFRGADITAYELFTDLILKQGGEKCFLQQNFRSAPAIVSVANEVCRRAMVQQAAFQPAYVPIFPANPARAQAVQWLFIQPPPQGAQADDYRHNQAQRVADWIKQNVGKLTLQDGRKLAYQDIAILSRASTTAGPYIDALRRRGIAFNVETDKDFYRKQEVNDFLNFLRAAVNPQDRIARTGVLRSPLGGFTDEEIYQLVKRGEGPLAARTKDPALASVYKLLDDFAQKAGRSSLPEWLQSVLDDTFLPEACAAAYEGERSLASLMRLVRLAQGYAQEQAASPGQFLARVADMLEKEPQRLGAGAAEDESDAVSVMTVHKSKGLGFPVVILVDLSKSETAAAAKPASHIFAWQHNMHGLRAGKICDANLAFLEEEQRKHSRCEEVRILYVALTRAKENLILVADGRKGAEKAAGAFAAAGLFPQEGQTALPLEQEQIPVLASAYEPPENFIYRPLAPALPKLPAQQLAAWKTAFEARRTRYEALRKQATFTPSQLAQPGEPGSAARAAGAQTGTLCHRALELLLNRPGQTVQQTVELAARQSGLLPYLKPALDIMEPFTKSELFAQLLGCRVLACEMPFSWAGVQGEVVSGVIDAVLEQPDGTVWVLDYKTDAIPPQGPGELLEKYRPQLSAYVQAVGPVFPHKKIRGSVILLRAFAALDL